MFKGRQWTGAYKRPVSIGYQAGPMSPGWQSSGQLGDKKSI